MSVLKTVLLKDICFFEKGTTGLAKAAPGKYPLVATGADRRSCDSFQFDTKAVCIPLVSSTGHGHASLKNVHFQEGKFALGSILVALTAKDENILVIQFLHLYLSQLKDQILVPLMSGAANVALSVSKIKSIEILLPSIDRQKEIVEKFNSIVVEENELKSELTHQQTLLKKLRQQILQDAVEGKLTEEWRKQNPDVEAASKLLSRIQAEKAKLIKEGKIKKQKPLPPITEKEKPFELPDGWVWCRLGDILINQQYGTSKKCSYDKNQNTPVLRIPNVSSGVINADDLKYTDLTEKEIKQYSLENQDLLVIRSNGSRDLVGRAVLVTESVASFGYAGYLIRLRFVVSVLHAKYVYQWFCSECARMQIMQPLRTTVGINNINSTELSNLMIPLPILPEQKAIVSKVEQIFGLCEQLEKQITQNQANAEQLMQAVLKEAFSG